MTAVFLPCCKQDPSPIEGKGLLMASHHVEIKAQVKGTITEMLFQAGEKVEQGEHLMTIDPRLYEAEVHVAQGKVHEDLAKLRYATDYADRYGQLVNKDYVSRLAYAEGIQNVDAARAIVDTDLATLKQAEIHLEFTQLRAPFTGYIGGRNCEIGSFIDPDVDDVVLATIDQIDPLTVQFTLPCAHLDKIRAKQREGPLSLKVFLPHNHKHPLLGKLDYIDTSIDTKTGMCTLYGTLVNSEEKGWPGQSVTVVLDLE